MSEELLRLDLMVPAVLERRLTRLLYGWLVDEDTALLSNTYKNVRSTIGRINATLKETSGAFLNTR